MLLGLFMVGCGVRGGQNTLADLEAEYNRAQDAIAHAEQLNATQHAPQVVKLAKERLQQVRDKQLSAPSVDVIRQYQYVQSLATRAALQSVNQQVSGVQDDLRDRPDQIEVDTSAIEQKLTSLENKLSNNSKSIDSLSRKDQRQSARLDTLEDSVGRIDSIRARLKQLKGNLGREPPTRYGDTLTRLMETVRRHNERLGTLCGGVRSLKEQLATHRNRIGKKIRGRHSGFVYPREESGLVGYWPFEKGENGKFTDVAGNLSVGRTVGSMQQSSGIFGSKGISFRESGSLLGISDHPDLDPGTKDGFAVSGWFSSGGFEGSAHLLNKWNASGGSGWYLSLSRRGLEFTMRGVNSLSAESNRDYLDERWHHFAIVYDRTGGNSREVTVKLYVDGTLEDRATGRLRVNTDRFLAIGGSVDKPDKFFSGSLDEVRIYRKSLSGKKVRGLAARPKVPVSDVCDYRGDVSAPKQREVPERRTTGRPQKPASPEPKQPDRTDRHDTGLIAHWPLNDAGDPWTSDRVGNNPGRVFGVRSGVPGKLDRAMQFHGDTDRIRVPSEPLFEEIGSFTVTAWVRPTKRANQYILTKGIPEDGRMASPYALFLTESEDIVFSINTTEGFNQIRQVGYNSGEWMFLAGTYDGSTISLYLNGEKVSDLRVEGSLKTNDLPIFLGSRYGAFGGINGRLDDVRLYNHALGESEIKNLPGL